MAAQKQRFPTCASSDREQSRRKVVRTARSREESPAIFDDAGLAIPSREDDVYYIVIFYNKAAQGLYCSTDVLKYNKLFYRISKSQK